MVSFHRNLAGAVALLGATFACTFGTVHAKSLLAFQEAPTETKEAEQTSKLPNMENISLQSKKVAKQYQDLQANLPESAQIIELFNGEVQTLQTDLEQWIQSTIWVDQQAYLNYDLAPSFLGLEPTPTKPFSRVGGPVLFAPINTGDVLRTGSYEPALYVPAASLGYANISFTDGVLMYSLSRTYQTSDGTSFARQATLRLLVPHKAYFSFQELYASHQKKSLAKQTFVAKQDLAVEADRVKPFVQNWLSSALVISGKTYVLASFPQLAQYLRLSVSSTKVSGPPKSVSVFGGEGGAVLYVEVSEATLKTGQYSPMVYVPLSLLATLGSSISLSSGRVLVTLERSFFNQGANEHLVTHALLVDIPSNLPRLTYQQTVDQHRRAQQVLFAVQQDQQAVAKRQAVLERNPQAMANFNRQVTQAQTALEALVETILLVDSVPHFAFTSNARVLGLQLTGDSIVGPSGRIKVMAGKGTAIKYSSHSQEYVRKTGFYVPTVYIPFNKLQLLHSKLDWDRTTNSLSLTVERKVEDITISTVVRTQSVTPGLPKQNFTYQQIVQRHQALIQAKSQYQQAASKASNQTRDMYENEREVVRLLLRQINARPNTPIPIYGRLGGYEVTKQGIVIWGDSPFRACYFVLAPQYRLTNHRLEYSYTYRSYLVRAKINDEMSVLFSLSHASNYECAIVWSGQ